MSENIGNETDEKTATEVKKARRGFSAMSPEKQAEIASKGGKAAHAKGVAHQWDKTAAKAAGSKGGRAAQLRWKAQQEVQKAQGEEKTAE